MLYLPNVVYQTLTIFTFNVHANTLYIVHTFCLFYKSIVSLSWNPFKWFLEDIDCQCVHCTFYILFIQYSCVRHCFYDMCLFNDFQRSCVMPSSTFALFIRHRFYKCTCSIESGDSAGYFSNSHLIAITVAATHCVGQKYITRVYCAICYEIFALLHV